MNSKLITLLLSAFLFFGRVDAGSGMSIEVGVSSGGQRHDPTVSVHVQDRNGHKYGGPIYGPNRNEGGKPTLFPEAKPAPSETPEQRTRREAQARQAAEKFTGWSAGTAYDMLTVNGNEYCRARNNAEEFLSLSVGRGWSKTSRELIGRQTFANQPSNLTFETTPYMWFFDKVTIGGKRYDHAWSDSLLDFLVPEGERHTICAPADFVKQFNLEKELERQRNAAQTVQDQCIRALQGHAQPLANMYFEETIWSALNVERSINAHEYSRAQTYADAALNYYDKAINALKPFGYFIDDVLEEMVTPGGIENLRKYRNGEISRQDYDLIVSGDIATDATASALGAVIGGSAGGLAGAPVGGPVGAVAGASAGSVQGAAVGYIVSRAAKATARASVSFLKGVNGGGSRERTQAVKEDTTRYVNGMKEKKALSESGRTLDGHLYYRIEKKCEYNGIQFKKGDYISLDTQHWEWELFRGPKNHLGAIDPIKGVLNKSKAKGDRILKLP